MANAEHLKILNEGKVLGWNEWRKKNPNMKPDLSGAVFDGEDLRGVNFQNTDLRDTSLRDAKLREAELYRAEAEGAKFDNADMLWARCDEASFIEASFKGARLKQAGFRQAILRDANFTGADCSEIELTEAKMRGACFYKAILISAKMERVECNNASFKNANLKGANLHNSKLHNAVLSGANCENSTLSSSEFFGANLRKVSLRGAQLNGANFSGVDLITTDFDNAIMHRATVDEDKIRPGQLSAEQLRQCGFTEDVVNRLARKDVSTKKANAGDEASQQVKNSKEQSAMGRSTTNYNILRKRFENFLVEKGYRFNDANSGLFLAYDAGPTHELPDISIYNDEDERILMIDLIAADVTQFIKLSKFILDAYQNQNNSIPAYIAIWAENDYGFEIYFASGKTKPTKISHEDFPEYGELLDRTKSNAYGEGKYGRGTYGGSSNEKKLQEDFASFLIKEKGWHEVYYDNDNYKDMAIDLSLKHPVSRDLIAVFTFKTYIDRNIESKAKASFAQSTDLEIGKFLIIPASKKSDYSFGIYKYSDRGLVRMQPDDFPAYEKSAPETSDKKFTLFDFRAGVDYEGSEICDQVIMIAARLNGLDFYVPHKSYLNIVPGMKSSDSVVAQLHRYGEYERKIALVIVGVNKGEKQIEAQLNEWIVRGEIAELSGYKKGPPKEIAWLNGNQPRGGAREKANVYVIESGILENPSAQNVINELLKSAKKYVQERDSTNKPGKGGRSFEEHKTIAVTATASGTDRGDFKDTGDSVAKSADSSPPITGVFGNTTTIGVEGVARKDRLGRDKLVKILAGMFVLTDCDNGFTMALLGDWGQGKSTVMGLLQTELKDKHEGEFEFATYNAWEYENTDNIAAGVAQEVVNGLCGELEGKERLKLMKGFVKLEHGEEIKRQLIYICIAMIIIAVGSLIVQSEVLKDICVGGGLVGLLVYMLTKAVQLTEHPLGKKIETYLRLPTYRKHLGLVPVLKRHLRTMCKLRLVGNKKLVVFVDDLDRCNVDHIAKVLDAVRLVMTIPNVIVMIGIDHRIAFKAIRKHYRDLADRNETRGSAEIARDYLGKIIQLPLRLKAVTHDELKEYVFEHLFDNENLVDDSRPKITTGSVDTTGPMVVEANTEPSVEDSLHDMPTTEAVDENRSDGTSDTAEDVDSVPSDVEMTDEEIYEAIKDKKSERDEFYELVGKFGFSNPRQLLRLHNSFRFLKGFGRGAGEGYDTCDVLKMLFWQEFLHNWKMDVRNRCMAALIDKVHAEKLGSTARKVLGDVRGDIVKLFNEPESYTELAELVRIVVLPHNEDGVLDAKADIEAWIVKADEEDGVGSSK